MNRPAIELKQSLFD